MKNHPAEFDLGLVESAAQPAVSPPGGSPPPTSARVEPDSIDGDPAMSLERLVRQQTGDAIHHLLVELGADGEVELRGWCRTYYIKQLAQQAILRAAPGTAICNGIEVR